MISHHQVDLMRGLLKILYLFPKFKYQFSNIVVCYLDLLLKYLKNLDSIFQSLIKLIILMAKPVFF